MRRLLLLIAATFVILASACGGDDADTASPTDGEATETAEQPTGEEPERDTPAAPELIQPELADEPQLLTAEYGLPGTSGWQTVVVFQVTNPSDHDLIAVPYRVTVTSDDGATAGMSEGEQTFSLRAGETRSVAAELDPTGPVPPTNAEVTLYETTPAGDQLGYALPVHADPALWEASSQFMACNTGIVGCEVSADVVFNGDGTQQISDIIFLVRNDPQGDGPLAFAGVGRSSGLVQPGQTVPVEGTVTPSMAHDLGAERQIDVIVFSTPVE